MRHCARLSLIGSLAMGCGFSASRPVANDAKFVDVNGTFGIAPASFECYTREPNVVERTLKLPVSEPDRRCVPKARRQSVTCSAPCTISGAQVSGPKSGSLVVEGTGWVGVSFSQPGDYVVEVGGEAYPVQVRHVTELRARVWRVDNVLRIEVTAFAGQDPLTSAEPEIFVAGEAAVNTTFTSRGVLASYKTSAPRRVQIYYKGFYLETVK